MLSDVLKQRVTAAYRAGQTLDDNPEPDNSMCRAAYELGIFDGEDQRPNQKTAASMVAQQGHIDVPAQGRKVLHTV